jgi:hypothetical protein
MTAPPPSCRASTPMRARRCPRLRAARLLRLVQRSATGRPRTGQARTGRPQAHPPRRHPAQARRLLRRIHPRLYRPRLCYRHRRLTAPPTVTMAMATIRAVIRLRLMEALMQGLTIAIAPHLARCRSSSDRPSFPGYHIHHGTGISRDAGGDHRLPLPIPVEEEVHLAVDYIHFHFQRVDFGAQ